MSGGNGTGPMGMGPMTGRAAGFCAGVAMPGAMNSSAGRGVGMGCGMGRGRGGGGGGGGGGGRGWRNRYFATSLTAGQQAGMATVVPTAPVTKEQERADLGAQVASVEAMLTGIRARLADLDGE